MIYIYMELKTFIGCSYIKRYDNILYKITLNFNDIHFYTKLKTFIGNIYI